MDYKNFVEFIKTKLLITNDKTKKLNIVREELQKNILYSIYSKNNKLYFLEWTNLRICYKLDRFSEDLDFTLEKPDKNYRIEDTLNWIISDFKEKNGYSMQIKAWNVATVQKAYIKFPNILFDTWVSWLKDEKVTIKLEVDTNPAPLSKYWTDIIKTSMWPCMIKNQDINSTFSWKMWALLLREYVKGRDYYDMYWYLENFPNKKFNLNYLNSIIKQYNTNNKKNVEIPKTHKDALNMILEKIEHTDYDRVKSDLTRFITWEKKQLDTFFWNYKNKMYSMITRYYNNIEKINNKSNFRL